MLQGKIILSCGHEDPQKPLGWHLYYSDYSDWKIGEEIIVHVTNCSRCTAARMLISPENLWFNYEEAKEAVFGQTR